MSYPVVTKQPDGGQFGAGPRLWSSGTFGCFDDMGSCIMGWLCSPILACRVAGDIGESACVPFCVPGGLIAMRTKMRTQWNIQGSIMDDCLMVQFCGHCIVCQMAREVDYVKRTAQ